jgi:cell division protein FtsZ
MGVALMGTGVAQGDDRAEEAARMAISSPLLEDLSIDGAHGVLINITGGPDLSLFDVNSASTLIQEAAHEDANIIFGAVVDDAMPEGEMRVTVIATGLADERMRRGRDEGLRRDHSNVTPLRREPSAPPERAPVTAEAPPPPPAPPEPAPARQQASEDWLSPFEEDELDVPTFLRKRGEDDEDDDREKPAFLRRSAD